MPGPEASLTMGLSPEQQGFLAQMADAMRRGQMADDGELLVMLVEVSLGRMVEVFLELWLSLCPRWFFVVLLVFLQCSLPIL